MTLITYPTRIHFADDVLEEALHSELEQGGYKAALLVMPNAPLHPEFEDRIGVGLPIALKTNSVSFSDQSDLGMLARQFESSRSAPDVIIAFGSARAIELARKCRYALGRTLNKRVPLFAILGVDGLPGPCAGKLESWHVGLPSVLICDPTVALDAGEGHSRRAWMLSVVRCCESYLASGYNPPADGMALDALHRCVKMKSKVGQSQGVELHRELMAAGLNASLSQEKGVGPAIAMSRTLAEKVPGLCMADAAGVVLPPVIAARSVSPDQSDALLKVLGSCDDQPLDQVIYEMLSGAGPKSKLRDLGVLRSSLDPAAKAAVGMGGLRFEDARDALNTVF